MDEVPFRSLVEDFAKNFESSSVVSLDDCRVSDIHFIRMAYAFCNYIDSLDSIRLEAFVDDPLSLVQRLIDFRNDLFKQGD